jgi:hypothetical protein
VIPKIYLAPNGHVHVVFFCQYLHCVFPFSPFNGLGKGSPRGSPCSLYRVSHRGRNDRQLTNILHGTSVLFHSFNTMYYKRFFNQISHLEKKLIPHCARVRISMINTGLKVMLVFPFIEHTQTNAWVNCLIMYFALGTISILSVNNRSFKNGWSNKNFSGIHTDII